METEEEEIELSDEMLEAIRIIRSDKRSADFARLEASHKEVIARLDKEAAERAASAQETKEPPVAPEVPGSESGNPPKPVPPIDAPQPPPKVDPPTEPPKKGKVPWWQRDNYKHD